MEIRLQVGLLLNSDWRQIRDISNERGVLLELSESEPAERHESKVSGAYSDDLWFWDSQQNLRVGVVGAIWCGETFFLLVPSSFVQTLRHHQGVMEITVAGPHEYPLFSDLARMLLQLQAVD